MSIRQLVFIKIVSVIDTTGTYILLVYRLGKYAELSVSSKLVQDLSEKQS